MSIEDTGLATLHLGLELISLPKAFSEEPSTSYIREPQIFLHGSVYFKTLLGISILFRILFQS